MVVLGLVLKGEGLSSGTFDLISVKGQEFLLAIDCC